MKLQRIGKRIRHFAANALLLLGKIFVDKPGYGNVNFSRSGCSNVELNSLGTKGGLRKVEQYEY